MNYNEMIYAVSLGETCYRLRNPSDQISRYGDTMLRNRGGSSIPFYPSPEEWNAKDWETKHDDESHVKLEVGVFSCSYIPESLKQPHERVLR